MKRITLSVLATFYTLFVIWVGGSDFERNSFGAVAACILSPFAFIIVWFYPGWDG